MSGFLYFACLYLFCYDYGRKHSTTKYNSMEISEKQRKPVNTENELCRAEEEERKKGFMKDLGWNLFFFTVLFFVPGFLIVRLNPYKSILFFASAFILDAVSIVSYIQYKPEKKSREAVIVEEDEKEPEHMVEE